MFPLLLLIACGGTIKTTENDDITDLEDRVTTLEAVAGIGDGAEDLAELGARVSVLEATSRDQALVNDELRAELAALTARLEAVEAAGDPGLADQVADLADQVASREAPRAWTLVDDAPTGGTSASWSPIHEPLSVDLSGGPVSVVCTALTLPGSRANGVRVVLTDADGPHPSHELGDEETNWNNNDGQAVISTAFSPASGPATVECQGSDGYFFAVELVVLDLGT